MAVIKKYMKKDGSTAYMFNVYLGVDPLTGKKKRTTRRGFRTQKEAKVALARLQLELESNGHLTQNFNTFKEVYLLWYDQYKTGVKESTALRVTDLFKHQILPDFGELRINKINTATCQKIINQWNEENAPTRLRSYTKKVFLYAIALNIIQHNPMENVLIPRKKQVTEKPSEEKFLDKQQLTQLLNLLAEKESFQTYLMFHVLAYTGLRKGELLTLTWEDIDFTNNAISVSKTGYYLNGKPSITTTKTKKSTRTLSIDPSTTAMLKHWKTHQKKTLFSRGIPAKRNVNQLVFSNHKNELMRNMLLNDVLKKYSEFNITPHGFRHTHASLLFEAGATIKQVQERLGHTSINTTMEIYTHVTKEAEKESAQKFLDYMNI